MWLLCDWFAGVRSAPLWDSSTNSFVGECERGGGEKEDYLFFFKGC